MSISAMAAQRRERLGTGASREVRRQAMVPGTVYGAGKDPESVAIDARDALKALHQEGFLARVIDLDVEGKVTKVLPRGIQAHPVTDQPMHVDFQRVEKGVSVKVAVPVHYINDMKSPGLKRGGVLNIVVHELLCKCDPANIPPYIEIDLDGAPLNKTFHLNEVDLPEGLAPVKLSETATLATIVAPSSVKSQNAAEEAEEGEGEEAEGGEGEGASEGDA